jgi:hypothetical protein
VRVHAQQQDDIAEVAASSADGNADMAGRKGRLRQGRREKGEGVQTPWVVKGEMPGGMGGKGQAAVGLRGGLDELREQAQATSKGRLGVLGRAQGGGQGSVRLGRVIVVQKGKATVRKLCAKGAKQAPKSGLRKMRQGFARRSGNSLMGQHHEAGVAQ